MNREKFVNDIRIVNKRGKYGAENIEGDIVINFIYDDLYFLKNYQNFLIGKKNGKSSIIDTKTLKPIVENITFERLPLYYKEAPLDIIIIKDGNGNLGLYNFSTGKYICGFTSVSRLDVDKFLINQGEKFGVISKDFETILPPQYDYIKFNKDNYIVRKENSWYIITPQNNFIPFDKIFTVETLTPTDDYTGRRLHSSLCLPRDNDIFLDDCYDHSSLETDLLGLLIVEKDCKEYLISLNNNGDVKFLSDGFDQISKVFCADRSVVKKDGKYGYIDLKGKLVIPCEFESAEQFKIGLHTEKGYDTEYCRSGRTREIYTKEIFYKTRDLGKALAKVVKNEFYGCINVDGTVVIPCVFDKIGEFVDGVAPATFYGINGQINENGEGFDIEKILSSFNNKENIEKLKKQYGKELGE